MLEILQAVFGVFAILFIAFLCSNNKKKINWRTVITAFIVQFLLGMFVLWLPVGKSVLLSISNGIGSVIEFGSQGINFLFGDLAQNKIGFIFAFNVLPVIIFFSALISVLYHLGIMGWIIKVIGGFLQRFLHTSRAESMSATANIFVGQIEAPLVVKPYLPKMTRSELFAVMVGGLASVSGSVLAGFASIGIELKYLIAASFMAAPAGLLMAKMLVPEIDKPETDIKIDGDVEHHANVIDAAAGGAITGLELAARIGAVLLAFVGLIALFNGLFGLIGDIFGIENLTMQQVLGYLFQPIAFLIGIPWAETNAAGAFIGQKVVINEFVAYLDFVQNQQGLSEKTIVIVTFALCGFANFGSIAVLLGGLGSLAPTRRSEIARYGFKAVIAGTLANLLSATIAGLFFTIAAI